MSTLIWPFSAVRYAASSGPSVILPLTIVQAVLATLTEAESLSAVAGGWWLGLAPSHQRNVFPIGRLDVLSEKPSLTSTRRYFEHVDLDLSVFALVPDDAERLGLAVQAIFDSESLSLVFTTGTFSGGRRLGGYFRKIQSERTTFVDVYRVSNTYRFTVSRVR